MKDQNEPHAAAQRRHVNSELAALAAVRVLGDILDKISIHYDQEDELWNNYNQSPRAKDFV